jgi:hypothetical protein
MTLLTLLGAGSSEAADRANFTVHVVPSITVASVIIPERKTDSGILIGSPRQRALRAAQSLPW